MIRVPKISACLKTLTGDYRVSILSLVQNHVPWGRLSLWIRVPGISPGVKPAGAFGWRPNTLVVPKVEKIQGLNLPRTPRATSACHRITLLYFYIVSSWWQNEIYVTSLHLTGAGGTYSPYSFLRTCDQRKKLPSIRLCVRMFKCEGCSLKDTCSETNMILDNKLTTAAAIATEAWPHSLMLPNLHHLKYTLQIMAEWNNNEQNLEEPTIHITTTYYSTVTQTHSTLLYTAKDTVIRKMNIMQWPECGPFVVDKN